MCLLANKSEKVHRPEKPWQVFVDTLIGRTMTLDAYPHMVFDDFLHHLGKKNSGYVVGMKGCRFIYGGKQLEPHRMPSDYGVQNGSTIHMVLRLHGGATQSAEHTCSTIQASTKTWHHRGL